MMDKLLLRPKEVAELIGIGRTKVFELMRSGQLESVRIGSSRRIPAFRSPRIRGTAPGHVCRRR